MRRMVGTLAMIGMLALGSGMARAQDDAATQAMQIAAQDNAMAQQAAQQAAQTANDMAQQAMQTMQQMWQQAATNNDMAPAAPASALPVTPRPKIVKLKGGVSVVLQDVDPKAIVFYTTDGSVPTPRSQRYVRAIGVQSKVRVRAMAFDLEDLPSGVVSKTIRVKS